MKPLITDVPMEKMQEVAKELGLKAFGASQIISWIYKSRVREFSQMSNLSIEAREELARRFDIPVFSIERTQDATDGTRKYLCRGRDGLKVECVWMPFEDGRRTVCISSQVGCAMACKFCRTASMGFVKNLTQGEILGQLLLMLSDQQMSITNVVLMGMGEPLKNTEALSGALEFMLSDKAFGLSKRRITLSTSGLIPELDLFSRRFDIKFAISLNATSDEVRSKIMPINKKYPIATIMEFAKSYTARSKHRITFEYVLIRDVNDSDEDIDRLIKLVRDIRCKVNIIPFNAFSESGFESPKEGRAEYWSEQLRNHGVHATIRISRGQEILAACGQLATERR